MKIDNNLKDSPKILIFEKRKSPKNNLEKVFSKKKFSFRPL